MELEVTVEKRFSSFALQLGFATSQSKVGVFGPSGSGKSTLVNLLAGFLQPDTGSIKLNGETLFDSRRSVPPEQRRIGIIFQNSHLFPHLSVKDNLLYGSKRCSRPERHIDFSSLVDVLHLEPLLARGVNNLSGGEKQRVAIGRAVLSSPRLLLMDEPLAALDDSLRFQITRHLEEVCVTFQIPYLFISHSLLEMRLMTDTVLIFDNGTMTGQVSSEGLACSRMGLYPFGYINLLKVSDPRPVDSMVSYAWGKSRLLVSAVNDQSETCLQLSSKEIVIFKRHPEVISARNLLKCTVVNTFNAGNRTGIELEHGGERLIAEVVRQAALELGISAGMEIYAGIKASAFRRMG